MLSLATKGVFKTGKDGTPPAAARWLASDSDCPLLSAGLPEIVYNDDLEQFLQGFCSSSYLRCAHTHACSATGLGISRCQLATQGICSVRH